MPTSLILDPARRLLILDAPGWTGPASTGTVAACQLYNTYEARAEWHPVDPDWAGAVVRAEGWELPCSVTMPFYGVAIRFVLCGRVLPGGQAVELAIPEDRLVEVDTGYARLMRLDLLPGFGGAAPGEDGHLLLPCLAGVLHRFTHTVSREERITIYAAQEQWALRSNFNCFGSHRRSMSWCAMVAAGDCDAEAVVRSHFDEEGLTSVHAGLVWRWAHTDARIAGDRAVRYELCDPAGRGWPEFARRHRAFLRAERGLRTWAQKAADGPAAGRFAGGFVLKIMQGYKTASIDGRGTYQSATSFTEAREILARMRADGITAITAQLVGWNLEGHDGCYPSRFPVNPVEGGEAAMRDLVAWGRDQGLTVTVHDNHYDSHPVGEDFDLAETVVLRDGTPWRNIPWAGGATYKLCPRCAMRLAERDLPRMQAMGIAGNYYLDAMAAFYPCHSPEHPADRGAFLAHTRRLLAYTRGLFGTLSLEVPFGPYFDLMDGCYSDDSMLWLDRFTPFRRQFMDELVPFLPIVLHNGVRYQRHGHAPADALRGLAWGAMPFIEISARPVPGAHRMPTWDERRDYALAGWRLSCVEHADRIGQDLDDVIEHGPDRFESVYADGVRLLVNAGDAPAAIAGRTVPALSVVRIAG